jgi:hypothetical protein
MGDLRKVPRRGRMHSAGRRARGLGEFDVYGFDLREGFEGALDP